MKPLVGCSFSVGHVRYKHDIRETYTENVDPELIPDDVTLVDK